MLERDLQKESCSCSKIVLVNRSNKARSSLLKEPKTVNPMVSKCGVDYTLHSSWRCQLRRRYRKECLRDSQGTSGVATESVFGAVVSKENYTINTETSHARSSLSETYCTSRIACCRKTLVLLFFLDFSVFCDFTHIKTTHYI
jgi:hypothetical protein